MLEPDGHINSMPVEAEHPNDAQAIAAATQRLARSVVEVWQGARQVAVLDPNKLK